VLWLWNNLHIVHHLHPTMPWYDIPGYYRANREHLLALNGGFVYSGYLDLTKRYLTRPTFVPVHPNV
jgi:fatty acid desaturase